MATSEIQEIKDKYRVLEEFIKKKDWQNARRVCDNLYAEDLRCYEHLLSSRNSTPNEEFEEVIKIAQEHLEDMLDISLFIVDNIQGGN